MFIKLFLSILPDNLCLVCSIRKSDRIFHCTHQKAKNGGCNARIRQDKETGVCRKDGWPQHNHPPELQQQQQLIIVNACVVKAGDSNEKPRRIFDEVRAGYILVLIVFFHQEMTFFLLFV